jgi:hypothetical protein
MIKQYADARIARRRLHTHAQLHPGVLDSYPVIDFPQEL